MPDLRRELGVLGERLAARHLEARGYEVVERNFRSRNGELDIVALGSRVLVFCEVKTRVAPRGARGPAEPFGPLAAVDRRKQRQVRRMAGQWLAQAHARRSPAAATLRFDAIGVTLSPRGELLALEQVETAF